MSPATLALHEGLEARRSACEERLVAWANLNSGSHHESGLARMRGALREALLALGAEVEEVPAEPSHKAPLLRARKRPNAPFQVLLSGHYDTVYGPEHPFQTCKYLNPDTLNGPGVADMKGGLVILCEALRVFESHPAAINLGWEVLLNPDEETGSYHSRQALAEAAKRHHLGLVFEPSPSGLDVVRTRLGTMVLNAVASGRAAHGSEALTKGRNAIVALSEFLVLAHHLNRMIPGIILNVGKIEGGGEINVVPEAARAEIHVRVPTREASVRVLEALHAHAGAISARNGLHLQVIGGINRPPKEALDSELPFMETLQACAKDLGQSVSLKNVLSASDANFLSAAGLPVIDGLGIDGDDLHSQTEHANLTSLLPRVRLLSAFLSTLAEKHAPAVS